VIACTSLVDPRELQSLFPPTVAKARFKCVILVKSILVAQLAKEPLQLSRYMTALTAGVGEPLLEPELVPLLEPELAPPLDPELAPLLAPDPLPEVAPLLEPELGPPPDPELVLLPAPDPLPEVAPLLEPELVPLLDPELVPLAPDPPPDVAPLLPPGLVPLLVPQAGRRGVASSAKVPRRTGRTFMEHDRQQS
jgi:hypothetical protein